MCCSFQPVGEVLLGHPAPPADLEPLVEIELISFEHHGSARQRNEVNEQIDESVPVPLLQRVVELIEPGVQQDRDTDQAELRGEQGQVKDARGPAVLGAEKRNGKPSNGGPGRGEAGDWGGREVYSVAMGIGECSRATWLPTPVCRRLVSQLRERWGSSCDSAASNGLRLDGGRTETQRARTERGIGTAEIRCDLTDTPVRPLRRPLRGARQLNG